MCSASRKGRDLARGKTGATGVYGRRRGVTRVHADAVALEEGQPNHLAGIATRLDGTSTATSAVARSAATLAAVAAAVDASPSAVARVAHLHPLPASGFESVPLSRAPPEVG